MAGGRLKTKSVAGVWFWIKWILLSITSFVASILLWDWLLIRQLGADFREPRTAIGWIIAVFGTWFLILVLLMAKKEKVMGHMDKDDESTVGWWLIWIALTIGSFFLAVWFWTPFIAARFGPIRRAGAAIIWVVAVFGTWLIALIPLMIFMYRKVDQAYEKARIRREQNPRSTDKFGKFRDPVKIKSILIDDSKRLLPKKISDQLKHVPATVRDGHLITATLKDGRKIEHVFISKRKELLGVYDQEELTFQASDIVSFEPADLAHPPDFTQKTWLRLDGNAA